MAITTMDQLVAAIAAGQDFDTYDASLASQAAGDFVSVWLAAGYPGAGAVPATGAGVVPTNATLGAIPFANPTGSNTLYLAQWMPAMGIAGVAQMYDRLVHTSGLSGTVTTAQTVDSAALTRYTSGANVQGWLEWYTATGSTAVTATISYTNSAGTAGRTATVAIPASAKASLVLPILLAAGDLGIQSIQTVTLSATTGTAGDFGITLTHRIASIAVTYNNTGPSNPPDYASLGLPIIQPNACLAFRVLPSSTFSGILACNLALVQG